MIIGANSNKPWNDDDIIIMQAYQALMDERCTQCGYPRYICDNESNDIQAALVEEHCSFQAKIDARNDSNSKSKNYKKPFGVIMRPEGYSVSGVDLSSYRDDYYVQRANERREIMESRIVQPES